MKPSILYILLTLIILFASVGIYYYYFYSSKVPEGIIYIKGNLDNRRIIPEDKGGLEDLDLDIYNMSKPIEENDSSSIIANE
jgi:hypothetical protein